MKELLTAKDISERMSISTNRVYQLMSLGAIPSVRIGGAIRVPKEAWDTWLVKKGEEALNNEDKHRVEASYP